MSSPGFSRRRFIARAGLCIAALPLGVRMLANPAFADADKPPLPLDDPQARALHYVETTEGLAHPRYKAGSNCRNCQFWIPGSGDDRGGCTFFPRHSVAARGWCSVWAIRA